MTREPKRKHTIKRNLSKRFEYTAQVFLLKEQKIRKFGTQINEMASYSHALQ